MIPFLWRSGKSKMIGIENSYCQGVGEGVDCKVEAWGNFGHNGTILYMDCGSGVSMLNSLKLITTVFI